MAQPVPIVVDIFLGCPTARVMTSHFVGSIGRGVAGPEPERQTDYSFGSLRYQDVRPCRVSGVGIVVMKPLTSSSLEGALQPGPFRGHACGHMNGRWVGFEHRKGRWELGGPVPVHVGSTRRRGAAKTAKGVHQPSPTPTAPPVRPQGWWTAATGDAQRLNADF